MQRRGKKDDRVKKYKINDKIGGQANQEYWLERLPAATGGSQKWQYSEEGAAVTLGRGKAGTERETGRGSRFGDGSFGKVQRWQDKLTVQNQQERCAFRQERLGCSGQPFVVLTMTEWVAMERKDGNEGVTRRVSAKWGSAVIAIWGQLTELLMCGIGTRAASGRRRREDGSGIDGKRKARQERNRGRLMYWKEHDESGRTPRRTGNRFGSCGAFLLSLATTTAAICSRDIAGIQFAPDRLMLTRRLAPRRLLGLRTQATMAQPRSTPVEDLIRERLAPLNPTRLDIFNDSQLHAHHAPMQGKEQTGETHFRLVITTAAFEDKRQPARHRMVYALLDDEMKRDGGIHALQLRTMTPAEEAAKEAAKAKTGADAVGCGKDQA
ncbi:uncharacterized protein SPSK_05187 [Sporothrix schenckii 1099-18]|nr:uncharacterized protein SPSK_05187 [Sporothrix schenckii 1099-18]KJR80855.1 hypothetical protein SPSK_05187 [Sporothrix schenckii 1099-18]